MYKRGSLIALSVIAAALITAVILDAGGPGGAVAVSRRVFPEFPGADRVVRVVWERPGMDATTLEQPAPGEFKMPGLPAAAVDQAAARDVLATLELLSYVRVEHHAGHAGAALMAERDLEPPRTLIRVHTSDGQDFGLRLGARIAELDRVWAARDPDHVYLVYLIEGYAARAIDRGARGAEELRARRVFALPRERISGVELRAEGRDLALSGRPAAVHVDAGRSGPGSAGGKVLADPDAFAVLAERLGELALVRFAPDAPARGAAPDELLTIRVHGGDQSLELVERGPCPGDEGLRLVVTTIGTGCVAAAVLDALRAYAGEPEAMFARTVLGGRRPVELTITAPGQAPLVLRAAGRAWALAGAQDHADATAAVESGAVDAWLEALEAGGAGRYQPASLASPASQGEAQGREPALTIEAVHDSGQRQRVAVYAGKVLRARRDAEPVVLLLDVEPFADRVLAGGPLAFRRRQLLSLEPYALRSATRRRGEAALARLERGALLDDWQVRVPAAGAPAAGIIDTLRELGRLRAASFLAEEPAPAHGLTPPRQRIELVFDAGPLDPDGAPLTHVLDIGARAGAGCAARLDGRGAVFVIDAGLCDALTGPWVE